MTGPVLVVDDGSVVSRELQAVLAKLRVESACAVSGPHALHLATEKKPRLVLTDLFVPGLDGLSLTRALEARGVETLILSSTAPAFAPARGPRAPILLRDEGWRPLLLERLWSIAGELSERTKAELAAWSQGEATGWGDAAVDLPSPPPASERPGPSTALRGASVSSLLEARATATELADQLLAALEHHSPAAAEEVLGPLREHDRPEVQHAAFQTSAALGAPEDPALFLAAAERADALPFVLLGACTRGAPALGLLEALARRASAPTGVRTQALVVWARRSDREAASSVLCSLISDGSTALVHAALGALAAREIDVLETLVAEPRLPPNTRAAAILVLGLRTPRASFDRALAIATEDPSDTVRAAAFEIGIKRLGARSGALLGRLVEDGSESSAYAALAGALDLGEAGFGLLVAMAALRLPPAVLRAVERELYEHYGVGEAPDPEQEHDHLVEDLKEELVPTRPEAPAEFVGRERLDLDFYTAPTEPRRPADAEPVLAPPPPPEARPTTRARSTKSRPASSPSRGRSRAQPPVAEEGPTPRELRARLDAAEAQGLAGFAAVVEIARNPRAPVDLRTRAIRHLGTELASPEAFVVLDALLFDEAASVQNAALGVFMVAGAPKLERFLAVAESPKVSAKVRARAVRHVGARFSREETTVALERLFEDPSAMVRRAALEGLFPSLKSLEGHALEDGLLNLMHHHASDRVRVSAARALAAFGTAHALATLDTLATSLFQAPEVGEAARVTIVRLRRGHS